MKKLLVITAIAFSLFSRCKKDCGENIMSNESCDTDSLVVIDSNSLDLQKFVTRKNVSSLFGQANAIKQVDKQGEIEWVGNNSIQKFPSNEYYLLITNYADTSWVGLEYWAYQRENIGVKFDPYTLGRQVVLDENAYSKNKTLNFARYNIWLDDYLDASWDINLAEGSYINVVKIDQSTKIVEGEFNLYFKLKEQSSLPGVMYSDKIRFRCGKFKSKIVE